MSWRLAGSPASIAASALAAASRLSLAPCTLESTATASCSSMSVSFSAFTRRPLSPVSTRPAVLFAASSRGLSSWGSCWRGCLLESVSASMQASVAVMAA